jgi:hypothetical protein
MEPTSQVGNDLPEFPHRPHWISQKKWAILLARYDDEPSCSVTGKEWREERLTVDHVVPRSEGGSDEPENLQFLTLIENLRKGTRPDSYWSKSFYWDLKPNLAAMRHYQRLVFNQLDLAYRSYFLRPRNEINRVLYLNAAIVGSGKTLAIPTTAWAWNRIRRLQYGPACPRAARILVLTKEQALRKQIALELGGDKERKIVSEIVQHGMLDRPPVVRQIEAGEELTTRPIVDSLDIALACVQTLWTRNGALRHDLSKVSSLFDLVFFDELHFGLDQVLRTVQGLDSICFGLTSTPITADGSVIRKCKMVSLYGYKDAARLDGAHKYLGTAPADLAEIVQEVGIREATIREGVTERTIHDTTHPAYKYALAAAKTVFERVVQYMKMCDLSKPTPGLNDPAPHRTASEVIADLHYPMHGMVAVPSIQLAQALVEMANAQFGRDRATYPMSEGWVADYVSTETEDAEGRSVSAKRLAPDHPFFMYRDDQSFSRRKDGKVQSAVRLLFVVGMGREGLNNRYCGVLGLAKSCRSIVEIVQFVGRILRSVWEHADDGRLHVPSRRMDTPLIVTHASYDNKPTLERGIDFAYNMDEKFGDVPVVDEQAEKEPLAVPITVDTGAALSDQELVQIAVAVGRVRDGESGPTPAEVIAAIAGRSPEKEKQARTWQQELIQRPKVARNRLLCPDDSLLMIPAVMRESPDCVPTQDALRRFAHIQLADDPKLLALLAGVEQNPAAALLLARWYASYMQQFHLQEFPATTNLQALRNGMSWQVIQSMVALIPGSAQEFKNTVHRFVGCAVKAVLGTNGEPAKNDSDWDCPQYHAILRRPDVHSRIVRWVRSRLLQSGFCPEMARAFAVSEVVPDEEAE